MWEYISGFKLYFLLHESNLVIYLVKYNGYMYELNWFKCAYIRDGYYFNEISVTEEVEYAT